MWIKTIKSLNNYYRNGIKVLELKLLAIRTLKRIQRYFCIYIQTVIKVYKTEVESYLFSF